MTKTAAQLEREIAEALGWVKVKVRRGWPETWERLMNGWWYTVERQPGGGWSVGYSHRRGDVDSIMRGSRYPTREAATRFAEEHSRVYP